MHMVAIGGSDAGISAALRAREIDLGAEVTVVVADAYPNSPSAASPTTSPARSPLAQPRPPHHRRPGSGRHAAALDTTARRIDVQGRKLLVTRPDGPRT